jgi:hypothetical protein
MKNYPDAEISDSFISIYKSKVPYREAWLDEFGRAVESTPSPAREQVERILRASRYPGVETRRKEEKTDEARRTITFPFQHEEQ